MIIGAIIEFAAGIFGWLLGLFPAVKLPTPVTGEGSGSVYSLIAKAAQFFVELGNWIPIPAVAIAFSITVWATLIALGIKIARIVLSFISAGGGSAA